MNTLSSVGSFCRCVYKLLATRELGNLEGKHFAVRTIVWDLGGPFVTFPWAATPFAPIMDDMTMENFQLPTRSAIETRTRGWEKLVIRCLIRDGNLTRGRKSHLREKSCGLRRVGSGAVLHTGLEKTCKDR